MSKYEITTQKKKHSIIITSLALFKEHGYSLVSMKMIASTSKVSQASIYNYFGGKEELVNECVQMVLSDLNKKTDAILQNKLSYKKKIETALSICTNELNESLSELITRESFHDIKFKQLLIESIDKQKNAIFRKFIELGKQTNKLDSKISTELYLSYISALNDVGGSEEFQNDVEENTTSIHKLFMYGLFGTP